MSIYVLRYAITVFMERDIEADTMLEAFEKAADLRSRRRLTAVNVYPEPGSRALKVVLADGLEGNWSVYEGANQ